jgi:hypothetical protein
MVNVAETERALAGRREREAARAGMVEGEKA